MAVEIDLAAASGSGIADLVHLVGEGHDGILLGEVFLQLGIACRAAPVIEIAGRQRGEYGPAVKDEAACPVSANDIALFAELVECGLEEAVARSADAERGLLLFVEDEINVLLEFLPEEAHQRVESDPPDFERLLGAEGSRPQAERKQQCEQGSFHRAAILRTSLQ